DRKSTRLNSSHVKISYAVFCLKKKISVCPGRISTRKVSVLFSGASQLASNKPHNRTSNSDIPVRIRFSKTVHTGDAANNQYGADRLHDEKPGPPDDERQ